MGDQDYNLTKNQQQLLDQFRIELRAFSNEHDLPEVFIDTIQWTRITEMAKELLKEFDSYEND